MSPQGLNESERIFQLFLSTKAPLRVRRRVVLQEREKIMINNDLHQIIKSTEGRPRPQLQPRVWFLKKGYTATFRYLWTITRSVLFFLSMDFVFFLLLKCKKSKIEGFPGLILGCFYYQVKVKCVCKKKHKRCDFTRDFTKTNIGNEK